MVGGSNVAVPEHLHEPDDPPGAASEDGEDGVQDVVGPLRLHELGGHDSFGFLSGLGGWVTLSG